MFNRTRESSHKGTCVPGGITIGCVVMLRAYQIVLTKIIDSRLKERPNRYETSHRHSIGALPVDRGVTFVSHDGHLELGIKNRSLIASRCLAPQ